MTSQPPYDPSNPYGSESGGRPQPGAHRDSDPGGQRHSEQPQQLVPRADTQGDAVYPYSPHGAYGGYAQSGPYAVHPYYGSYPPYGSQGGYGAPPYGGYPAGYYGPAGYPGQPRRRNRGLLAGLAAIVVLALAVSTLVGFTVADRQRSLAGQGVTLPGGTGGSGNSGSGNGSGSGTGGFGSGSTNTGTGKRVATSTEQAGIVTIVSVLKYQNQESAGTGMILTSNGEILTNNHVVNGATSITVTVESTGRSYRASVVGTAPTKDVAVLRLADASGLTTAKFASTADDVKVGDAVTGVGNAGGTGTLTAASGKVTDLGQTITATSESGANPERLHDLIEIDAPIMSGDSGGPLYDADGDVIGIDTAASASQVSNTTHAFAITIDNAMSVARQILSGVKTTTIHIGLPGFLGVAPSSQTVSNGVGVAAVEPGLPAAKAGIGSGSVITAVGGTRITSSDQLHNKLAELGPGDRTTVTWTDSNGTSHTKQVTLATGPAD